LGRKLLALSSSPVLQPLLEPGDLHPKVVGGQSRLAALYPGHEMPAAKAAALHLAISGDFCDP
jgi:hypothetical protein